MKTRNLLGLAAAMLVLPFATGCASGPSMARTNGPDTGIVRGQSPGGIQRAVYNGSARGGIRQAQCTSGGCSTGQCQSGNCGPGAGGFAPGPMSMGPMAYGGGCESGACGPGGGGGFGGGGFGGMGPGIGSGMAPCGACRGGGCGGCGGSGFMNLPGFPVHRNFYTVDSPQNLQRPPANAPAATVNYPYYTHRGPTDFFMN